MISGISTSNSHMHIADVHKTGLTRLEVDIITFMIFVQPMVIVTISLVLDGTG